LNNKSPLGSAVTETDNKSCLNNPLGCGERVFEFLAMFGAITDLLRPKVGDYIDRKAATGCTVMVWEQQAVAGVPAAKDVSKC
jgi:hypothetical protein